MLSGLSSQQSLTGMPVNGAILKDEKLAEAIGESFYRVSSDITPLNFQPMPVTSVPDSYTIFPEAVEAQLSRVKERKATGPDEIPNWILKSCASTLSILICSIFNASIKNGNISKL